MSDEMHMIAIMHQRGGSYMAFTSFDTDDSVICPTCRTAMPIKDIVAGRFERRTSVGEVIGGLFGMAVLIGGIFLAVRSCS